LIVADVNLLAYLLIEGPFSAAAQAAFDRDGNWIAPPWWRPELLNPLATTVRNRFMSYPAAQQVWDHAPAYMHDVEPSASDTLSLSVSSGVATYDCSYVELARQRRLRVVTEDGPMLRAFPDTVVSIRDFAAGK
jgi:predicted nucleic acid-binding protein